MTGVSTHVVVITGMVMIAQLFAAEEVRGDIQLDMLGASANLKLTYGSSIFGKTAVSRNQRHLLYDDRPVNFVDTSMCSSTPLTAIIAALRADPVIR